MKELYWNLRKWYHILYLSTRSTILRKWHSLRGQKLSPHGKALRDYIYECMSNPAKMNATEHSWQEQHMEEVIADCMKSANCSREHTMAQMLIQLMEYEEEKDVYGN